MSKTKTFLMCIAGFGLLFTGSVRAQVRSAIITGSVVDESGATVPNADVTITNTGTNAAYKTKTTAVGQFAMPYLEAGTYTVEVTAPGFTLYRESGLNVATDQTARVDVHLKVGAVGERVEVTAEAVQIQTDSTQVANVTTAAVINDIPNVTQNPLFYAMLQNGVQPRNETSNSMSLNSFGIGVAGRAQFTAIGVNGGRAYTNDIQLDGLPIMGGGFNETAIVPNTEGLQEVRVISNNFTAEYGHGQAVVAFSTKSGTNQFHGQADYLLRNEALNANTNSNNANGLTRTAFKVNQFGGAISGPIKKNKLFFFSSYHFLMFNQGQTYLDTVPTALERVGDFSKTFIQSNGAAVPAQLYNPSSVIQTATDLYQRAPFPNAIIPNPNPFAVHMYSFYPQPNRTPNDVYNTANYQASVVNTVRRHTLNNRVDYKLGMHSIYGSGGFDYGDVQQPVAFGTAPFNNAPTITRDRNPYGQVGDTIVLSPTLVLDVRYGATRIIALNLGGNRTGFTDYAAFGIPASTQALFAIYGAAPIVNPNGFGGGSGGGSNWTTLSQGQFVNKQEHQLSHALNTSITKVRGKWTHKAGVEFRVLLSNYHDMEEASTEIPSCCANVGGNYTFQYVTASGSSASQNTSPVQNGINGAALLVGENVWWVRPGENVWPAFAQKYMALYSQNDWRATSRLTVNLGLRWDLQPGTTERYNRIAAYDFTQTNPFGAKGAIVFPGSNGLSRNMWPTEYHDFGPRVGAAYQLGHNMVLRSGFGITYLPSNTGYFSSPNEYGEESFSPGTNMLPYGLNPAGVPVTTFSDPAPIVAATGASLAAPQIYGGSNALFTHSLKNGIAKQGNLFVEKSFGKNGEWLMSVGYSFSYSNNLQNRNWPFQNMQNIPQATLNGWLNQYIASNGATNPANVQVPNPWQPSGGPLRPFQGTMAGATIPQYISLLPYPLLYGSGAGVDESNGYAGYNALMARFAHTFSYGVHAELNYTWSKELDYTSSGIEDGQGVNSGGTFGGAAADLINPQNNKHYGLADQPHRFVGIMTFESPFGTGKHFALGSSWTRAIVGNWTLGTVVTLQSGMPFVISGDSTGAMVARPNRIPGVSLTVPAALQHWYNGTTSVVLPCGIKLQPAKNTFLKYNPCAFQGETLTTPNGSIVPNEYWVGNSDPTIGDFRGPGRINVDLSLRRIFVIRERLKLELAADATNLLNSAEYNGNFNGNLGNTNLTNNPAAGLTPGYGNSSTFGTLGLGTFDPRQITMHLRVQF
ncbi:MAG TPA: TonB-dependent receptor [Bryobacteraceae bacterium]|nr:TonB-dependent receptor [Bryobacteraceae bacterium]